jgi:SAM-dependent methyltransferase
MDKNLNKAQLWADRLWKRAAKNWINRKQDLNYRKYVARPAIEKILSTLPLIENGLFLDLGCGSGDETLHLRNVLAKKGFNGRLIGIDHNDLFVKNADKYRKIRKNLGLSFRRSGVTDLENEFANRVDLVVSIFLLQDLPDAEIFFKSVSKSLKKDGYGIFLLVHPDFAKRKMTEGYLKVEEKLRSRYWKWAAQYPIIEEGGKTFHVPYFHRTICNYLLLARKYFRSVSLADVMPSKESIKEGQKKKLSPLYCHPGNVYCPEIIKVPSSLIIKIQK